MRSAACSAAAPATARSSQAVMDASRRARRRSIAGCRQAATPSARRRSGSTACRRSPAPRASAPTASRPMRCRCWSSARRIIAPRFAFGDLDAFVAAHPGIVARLHRRATFPAATASASSRLSPTSRRSPKATSRFRGEAVALDRRRARRHRRSRPRGFPGRLDRAAALLSPCEARGRRRAPHPRRPARQSAGQRARRARRRRTSALAEAASCRLRDDRDVLRRARLYRAGGRLGGDGRRHAGHPRLHAGALHGPRRHGRRARPCRRKRCASCRPPPAAASAPSSTCRCSR